MNSPPPFRLRLFGNPSLAEEDGTLLRGPAAQRHRLALLAFLALARDRGASRDKLLAYLWPENDAEHGRLLLNQAVYSLRKTLGEGALQTRGDGLRLNSEIVQADVAEFEDAIERGDLHYAAQLYREPFLDGFFLRDAPEFERWVDRERGRLTGAYAKLLEDLADGAETAGDATAVLEWWKARAAHDPYDSRVALRLMRVLESGGNRAGALQHAAAHRRLLREEFGLDSVPEIETLEARLRSEPASGGETQERNPAPSAAEASRRDRLLEPAEAGSSGDSLHAEGRARRRRRTRGFRYGIGAVVMVALLFGASQRSPQRSEPVSIAVLPLVDLTSGPAGPGLAESMTEALISKLAMSGLRVIASTSVFSFRDRGLDVRAVGDSLRVSHVLEGVLETDGLNMRVQIRLMDARDGAMRWSETYDRDLREVSALQNEIAHAVARELGTQLAGGADTPPARPPTLSVAAYELYVRGSDRALLRSDSAAREGVKLFQQAIQIDSFYAAAWAGLAQMYARVASSAPLPDRGRYWVLAEAASERALELDESLAEAHGTMGICRMAAFDFASAERHLTRALVLDPSAAVIHEWMVTLYLWTGRAREALAHADVALELDPLSPYAHAERARALLGNGRCNEAIAELDRISGVYPPLLRAAPIAALCHAHGQRWTEAIAVLRPQADGGEPTTQAQLAFLLARSGEREQAVRIHESLLAQWRRGGGAYPVAVVYVGLGDFDEAFIWLDRSIADRSLVGLPGDQTHLMLLDPLFAELRRDPRFRTWSDGMGLQDL